MELFNLLILFLFAICTHNSPQKSISQYHQSFHQLYPVHSHQSSSIYDHHPSTTMLEISLMDPKDFHSSIYKKFFEHRRHYLEIVDIANKNHTQPSLCRSKLDSYYKNFSPWRNLSFEEKLKELFEKTSHLFSKLKIDEMLYGCFIQKMMPHYQFIKEDLRTFYTNLIRENKLKNKEVFPFILKSSLKKIPVRPFFLLTKEKFIYLRWPITDLTKEELEYQFSKRTPNDQKIVDFLVDLTWPLFLLSIQRTILDGIHELILLESLKNPFLGRYFYIPWVKESPLSCGGIIDLLRKYIPNDSLELLQQNEAALNVEKINPYKLHPKLNVQMVRCIAYQESHSLNPMEANYTFCSQDERMYMRSSAIGLGQTTFRTFNWLRSLGKIPLPQDGMLNPEDQLDNQFIFESIPSNVDLQLKIIFYHLNYLLTKTNQSKSTIIKYDTDDQSRYIKNVSKCIECLEKSNSIQCAMKQKGKK